MHCFAAFGNPRLVQSFPNAFGGSGLDWKLTSVISALEPVECNHKVCISRHFVMIDDDEDVRDSTGFIHCSELLRRIFDLPT